MGLFRKKREGEMNIFLKRESLKPAYVDPQAFTEIAERIVKAYLFAVYSQDREAVPQVRLEERFYCRTLEMIESDRRAHSLTCSDIVISSIEADSADIAQQFAVRSISYDVCFTACGMCRENDGTLSYPYEDRRLGTFTFLNDSRLGWILSGHTDYGAR